MQRVYAIIWRYILATGHYSAMGARLPATLESIKLAYDASGLALAFTFAEFVGFVKAMDGAHIQHMSKR